MSDWVKFREEWDNEGTRYYIDDELVFASTAWFSTDGTCAKVFTGIQGAKWYPADPEVEMEPGVLYRIDVRGGKSYATRIGHRFDV